jgi:hypothetical protein
MPQTNVVGMRAPEIYPKLDPRSGIKGDLPEPPEFIPGEKPGHVLWRSEARSYRVSLTQSHKALNAAHESIDIAGKVAKFEDGWYQAPTALDIGNDRFLNIDELLAKCEGVRVGGLMWRYRDEQTLRGERQLSEVQRYAEEHPEEFAIIAQQILGPGHDQDFDRQLAATAPAKIVEAEPEEPEDDGPEPVDPIAARMKANRAKKN